MKQYSKSEINELNSKLTETYGLESYFSKKDRVIREEFEEYEIIVKDKEPLFFIKEGKIIPLLKLLLKKELLKKITVDMGAVKFVTSGADVMRPGITKIEEGINKHEFVVVVDETHGKPLAVAKTIYPADEMREMEKGKVLKNIHYVGDKLWTYSK